MMKILFVCLGNICRSPMAEFVMKDLVEKQGLADQFLIASAGTSDEEHGNPVHRGTKQKLAQKGISTAGKYAVQMKRADYDAYDYLIGMEQRNLSAMRRIAGGDPEGGRFTGCWISPAVPGISPIPGTPAILTPPMTIFMKAASVCSII